MNELTYMTVLKRALRGLPAADIADILGDCQRHFVDARAAGRSEADIVRGLGDPRQMAIELRATAHVSAYQQKGSTGNLMRLLSVLMGMLSFNLLMVAPAMVPLLLLLSAYLLSGASIVAGALIVASGLTGVEHIGVAPGHPIIVQTANARATAPRLHESFTLEIGDFGVHGYVHDESAPASASQGLLTLDGGSAATKVAQPDRLRAVYGFLYIVFGIALWRLSGKIGKALLLGMANYLRFNFKLLNKHRPARQQA